MLTMSDDIRKKIYIAECYDRHIDPVIRVFDNPAAAIEYAKSFAYENAAHKDTIKERVVDGVLFCCDFSVEGDYVLVREGTMNDNE